MGNRKNIWETIAQKEIDVTQEFKFLWQLFNEPVTIGSERYIFGLKNFVEKKFRTFEHRQRYLSFSQFMTDIKFPLEKMDYSSYTMDDLDELLAFTEVLIWILKESNKIQELDFTKVDDPRVLLNNNINSLLSSVYHSAVELPDGKHIIVPDSELVAEASNVIAFDDEQLAMSVLRYSHYSQKNDIREKRNILAQLANYMESRIKDKDINYVMNNFGIRHGGTNNIKLLKQMSEEELNDLYDSLYRDVLYQVLKRENKKFQVRVADLKKRFSTKSE